MHRVFQNTQPAYRVLGADLLPLTIGHIFLLRDLGCGLTAEKLDIAIEDLPDELLTAVYVCARPHAKARKEIQSRLLPWFLRYWGFRCRSRDLMEETAKFIRYYHESLACPRQIGGSGGMAKTPYEWRLLATMVADFGLSIEAAKDLPVTFATGLWAANADRLGRADFVPCYGPQLSLIERAIAHQREKDRIKFGGN